MPATLIDGIDGFGLTTQPLGPYQAAGLLWAVLADNSAFVIRIFKSSDSGATWSEADAAHHPGTSSLNNNIVASVIQGTTISVAFTTGASPGVNGGTINVIPFNCATGLWGSATGGGPTVGSLIPSILMTARSDLSLVIVYGIDTNSGSNTNTAFTVYTGSFSAQVNISPSLTADDAAFGIVLGASNRTHVFTGSPIATGNINHTTINSDNSVGARRTIASHFKNPEFDAPYTQPTFDGTNLFLPVTSDPASVAHVLTATEAIDPTPWTDTSLADTVAFFFSGTFLQASAATSGTQYAFFTTNNGVNLEMYSNSGSGWGTGTAIYSSSGHVASISARVLSGGTVSVVFSEKPTSGGSEATRTMYLVAVSGSPPPAPGTQAFTELFLWQIQALPDQVFDWRSQYISHGMNGYHHIGAIMAAYVASANVTLSFSVFDGTPPANITLPSTGGAYQGVWINPTFNKAMLYRYIGHSANPFQFVLKDWIAYVKPWGDTGPYRPYRLVGEG